MQVVVDLIFEHMMWLRECGIVICLHAAYIKNEFWYYVHFFCHLQTSGLVKILVWVLRPQEGTICAWSLYWYHVTFVPYRSGCEQIWLGKLLLLGGRKKKKTNFERKCFPMYSRYIIFSYSGINKTKKYSFSGEVFFSCWMGVLIPVFFIAIYTM